jgi:hypothetical protein
MTGGKYHKKLMGEALTHPFYTFKINHHFPKTLQPIA